MGTKELWRRFNKLNASFAEIKQIKKENNKKEKLVVYILFFHVNVILLVKKGYFKIMSASYSLSRVRIHKKEKIKKLNNLSTNFEKAFYKN